MVPHPLLSISVDVQMLLHMRLEGGNSAKQAGSWSVRSECRGVVEEWRENALTKDL